MLNNMTLKNKAGIWKSDAEWSLKSKGPFVYVENIPREQALFFAFNDEVTLVDLENRNKRWALFKKVKSGDDEYFKLTNPSGFRVLTAKNEFDFKQDGG